MLAAHALERPVEPCEPSAQEAACYLRELLGKNAFETSERNRRFLAYVAQETLAGRADRIKAYSIALAAFGRTEDFDPLTDPIVRIEASRLRRSLEHYYLTAGKADRIRIEIPKGSYAATFSYQTPAPQHPQLEAVPEMGDPIALRRLSAPKRVDRRWHMASLFALMLVLGMFASYSAIKYGNSADGVGATLDHPSLVIMPFEDTGGDPKRTFVARGLTFDVATALTQLRQVAIFGPEPGMKVAPARPDLTADYALTGSVQIEQHSMRVAVFLVDARTGQYLQSWSFQKDLVTNDLINAQAEVAQQILAAVRAKCTQTASNRHAERASGPIFDCRRLSLRFPNSV